MENTTRSSIQMRSQNEKRPGSYFHKLKSTTKFQNNSVNQRSNLDDMQMSFYQKFLQAACDKEENARQISRKPETVKASHFSPQQLERKLTKIFQTLTSIECSNSQFLYNFPKWAKHRMENIENLLQIAKTLQNSKKGLDAGKVIGSSIQIIGELLSLFGGASKTLGKGAVAAGVGIRVGCGVSQPIVNFVKSKRVREALEKDKEEFELLGNCFKYFCDLNEELEEFGGHLVFEKILEALKESYYRPEVRSLMSNFKNFFSKPLPSIKDLQYENPGFNDIVTMILSNKYARDISREIIESYNELKPIIEAVKEVLPNLLDTFSGLKDFSLQALLHSLSSPNGQRLTSAVNIAINVCDVYLTVQKFNEPSELAQKTEKLVTDMQNELLAFSGAFNRLKEG